MTGSEQDPTPGDGEHKPLPFVPLAIGTLAGLVIVALALAAVVALSDDDGDSATTPVPFTPLAQSTPVPRPTADPEHTPGPDDDEIEALARKSIEVLPAGEWPSLYDDYTSEFHERCAREDFEQLGLGSALQVGMDLQDLRFVRLEDLVVEDGTAQAVIVGDLNGEYEVFGAFQKEDGVWKIAPWPSTQGCFAFGQEEAAPEEDGAETGNGSDSGQDADAGDGQDADQDAEAPE